MKEALLAYYERLVAEAPLSRVKLARRIEQRFAAQLGCRLDFEIDDALQKLQALALVQGTEGRLKAVPLPEAIRLLNRRWDDDFRP